MIIETLLIKCDGSQEIIHKEVPDDWFNAQDSAEEENLSDRASEPEQKPDGAGDEGI